MDHRTHEEPLERDLAEKREQLDQTLSELEDRLTVDHLMEEARDRARHGLQSAVVLARRHPFPIAAAAALTLAYVIRSRSRARERWIRSDADVPLRVFLAAVLGELTRRAQDASAPALQAAQDTSSRFLHGAQQASKQLAAAAEDAYDHHGIGAGVLARAADLYQQAQRRLRAGAQSPQSGVSSPHS